MNKVLKENILRAFSSVLPVTAIVLVASVVLVPMPSGIILMFLTGAAFLIIGMGFFIPGADMAMRPMGEGIGIQLTKISNLALVLVISFVIGIIVTVADPDLQVLAKRVSAIPYWDLVLVIALGGGFFLVIAVLRTLFKIRLSILLIILYAIIFGVCYFVPGHFVPIAFESGAIANGPITVPFILAIGMGLASVRSDKDSQDDSFGMVALASIGTVFAMFLLGLIHKPPAMAAETALVREPLTSRDAARFFADALPHYLLEVSLALGCIIICFIVFQLVSKRYHHHQLGRIVVGFFYTLIGLVFFLTGLNVGFIPAAHLLGAELAASGLKWILIPVGTLIGYFTIMAEPEVHIFNKDVEEISEGAITVKMMNRGLAVGMAAAVAITMTRILLGIPVMWILIPGYALVLALTFFVPKIFTGIAFDSGAVCSGPMSATFLLPFAIGVVEGTGKDMMIHAFGIVAMIAMTPLIVIQIMGLVYQVRAKEAAVMTDAQTAAIKAAAADMVIDWGKITVFGEGETT